jgi:hypothetical protein
MLSTVSSTHASWRIILRRRKNGRIPDTEVQRLKDEIAVQRLVTPKKHYI